MIYHLIFGQQAKLKQIFLFVSLTIFCNVVCPQNFSGNIKVNHLTNGEQNSDGSNSIAVSGNKVYVLWQDMGGTYFSYVSKSIDGGVTFGEGVKVGGDKPQLFGSITCDNAGVVYVAWSALDAGGEMPDGIYFAKSVDGGVTFTNPVTVSLHGLFATIKVYNNNVYISYYATNENNTLEVFFTRSTNGGTSFETPYPLNNVPIVKTKFDTPHSMCLDNTGVIYCIWNDGRRGGDGTDIYWAKSVDNGVSFTTNIIVNDINGSRDKLRTAPSIAVAGSNVYAFWREETDDNGANRRVLFAKSGDGGKTFSAEREIALGGWGSPKLVMNNNGDIYLGYPQYSPLSNGIFCAKSIDQGVSFPVTAFINDKNTDARNLSIAVDQNDVLYTVWTDNRNGNKDVFFSKGKIIVTDLLDDQTKIPTQYALFQNYPNPFNPETTIRYDIPVAGNVTLKLYDILGNEVTTLVDEYRSAGSYSVKLSVKNFELATGIYFYQLISNNFIQTKKIVLVK